MGNVEKLKRRPPGTRRRVPQRVVGASDAVLGFLDPRLRREVVIFRDVDHQTVNIITRELVQDVVIFTTSLNQRPVVGDAGRA